MQARFLLGPAGSGKTFRCLAEVRAELLRSPEGRPLILLAPKQATFQLERQLLADPALQGYTRLHILSFERLARFVLDALGVAPPRLLGEEGRVMVLRALLMRHEGELKLFRRSARSPGFARQLSALLCELQNHGFSTGKLTALSRREELPGELQAKLHDLALLRDAYANWLAEHKLQDADRLLDAATEALLECGDLSPLATGANSRAAQSADMSAHSKLSIAGLWFDGFAEMTPVELDLLAAIGPRCERATLAFCLDESGEDVAKHSWLSNWAAIGRTYQQCRQRMQNLPGCEIDVERLGREPKKSRYANSPALQRLEADWSKPASAPVGTRSTASGDAVRVIDCANPDTEAMFAAREILRFVRGGGRFRDAAVLVRDLEGFHKPLARGFRRYGIPFFLDRRESVSHHPLAELTRSALRTVAFDWQHEDWFAALKTGFSPVEETEIDWLENEALARGWRGAKWREPLPVADDPPLEKTVERLRKKLLPPFDELAEGLESYGRQPNGAQLAGALREIWSALGVESKLEEWSSAGGEQSAIHLTVWQQMNAWLDNLELAFPREPMPLRDWLPILEAGLAGLTVGVIPPALDQVLLGAIDRSRNPDLKLALVLGLNEGIFPAAPIAPTLLTDADRETLGRHGGSLGPDLRDRLARERFLGYIACTRASERLVATFSRLDAEGKPLNPSPFISHLQRQFPQLAVEEFRGEVDLRNTEHASELVAPLAAIQGAVGRVTPCAPFAHSTKPGAHGVTRPTNAAWSEVLQLPALAALQESLRLLRNPEPAERLLPGLAEEIFGPALQTSVSRLEQFAACPFKFFVHSGLHAEERKLFELDAREQGSFQHEVLKCFHEELSAGKKRWRDLSPQAARERIGKIADALAADYRDGLLRDTEQSRFTARVLTESLQDFIEVLVGWMRGQYEFEPAAAELEFGGAKASGWELDLGEGRTLVLRGRMDRVDMWREPGRNEALCVVMDYKSSQKKLDPLLMRHGVQLQLPGYLAALRRWPDPRERFGAARLIPAGVFFVNLRGKYEHGASRAEALADPAEARRRAYRHTGRFDASVVRKLDSRPDAKHGDQFNYRLKQDGGVRANSAEALEHAQFEALLDNVETQLKEMGQRIFSGDMRVDPYRKGKQTPCEFCDYAAICRIDPWTHHYRVLGMVEIEVGESESPSE